MRMVFGLVGLLITVAIMAYLFVGPLGNGGGYMQTIAKTKKEKTQQVQQFGGKTKEGVRADTFATFEEVKDGFQVTGLTGGPFVTDYGLQVGDIIVEVRELPVKGGFGVDTEEDLRNWLDRAFAASAPITVKRGELGTEVELKPANAGNANPLQGLGGLGGLGGGQ